MNDQQRVMIQGFLTKKGYISDETKSIYSKDEIKVSIMNEKYSNGVVFEWHRNNELLIHESYHVDYQFINEYLDRYLTIFECNVELKKHILDELKKLEIKYQIDTKEIRLKGGFYISVNTHGDKRIKIWKLINDVGCNNEHPEIITRSTIYYEINCNTDDFIGKFNLFYNLYKE